jgi:hypothetical protein
MLLTICRNYRVLPEPRSMKLAEIRWFYDGIRESLKEATKPKSKK